VKFDDLIGILFLLFFILGPALKGLFKPSEPLIEVELPEIEPESEAAAPDQPEPHPAPQQEPVAPAPVSFAIPERNYVAAPPAAPEGEAGQESTVKSGNLPASRRKRKLGLKTDRRTVINGMLWHEVLSEPVALKRLKQRRRGAKL